MIDDVLRARVAAAVEAAGGEGTLVTLDPPRDVRHGDLATTVALQLAKTLKQKPLDIAQRIVAALPADDFLQAAEIAPPGFLNFRLTPAAFHAEMARILDAPDTYGCCDRGAGQRVQVEFVSANPTGPLNVVSARAASVGDTLVRLLRAAGFDAQSEFYVNDAGNQVDLLAESFAFRLAERFGRVGTDGLPAALPEEGYKGAYVTDLAQALSDGEAERLFAAWRTGDREPMKQTVLAGSGSSQRSDLARFRVEYDMWFSESTLHAAGRVEETRALLAERGQLRDEDGAVWFVSTPYGDDKDRVVVRADGRPTYLLADIAYHRDKHERGFARVIDIWGPDHHGYVARMQAAAQALGYGADWLEVMILQQVTLKRDGEVVKMSKRAGEFVTLVDLLDEVGVDAARFFFLMRRTSSPLDFDLTLAREASDANPVYYVQYAHARITQLAAKAAEAGVVLPEASDGVAWTRLTDDYELALMRQLAAFPRLILGAALAREPHRVPTYLQELATAFHAFYHNCRVISDDRDLSRARLALARATQIVVKRGLDLMGVSAPESM